MDWEWDDERDLAAHPRLTSRDRRSGIAVWRRSELRLKEVEKVTGVAQGVRVAGVAAGVGAAGVCWRRKMVGVCAGDVRCTLGGAVTPTPVRRAA